AVPHSHGGAEGTPEPERGGTFRPLGLDEDRTAVGVDYGHGASRDDFLSVTHLYPPASEAPTPKPSHASAVPRCGESAFPVARGRSISRHQNDGEGQWP